MAKQSGLHQLRGKVGEHSYYRQTGVAAGLMRSINQGMSARVKNDPAFANTRRNNSEFAGACDVAHLLGLMVTPKYRPMILPFSQSNMSKKVLEIAKVTNAIWGQRVVPADSAAELSGILTAQSKLAMSDLLSLSLTKETGNDFALSYACSGDQATTMAGLDISGFVLVATAYNLATGKFNALTASIRKGFREIVGSNNTEEPISAGSAISGSISITIPESDVDTKGWNSHQIVVAVLLPYRTINEVDYTLQEYCRFAALPVVRA
jgi:hypothetical protein